MFNYKLLLEVAFRADEEIMKTYSSNYEISLLDGLIKFFYFPFFEETKKQKKLKRFVFASSAAVYGDEPSLPKKESSPIKPVSLYGIDKYCAEQFAIQYCQIYGLPTVALRYFNVYGQNQGPSSLYAGVISLFIKEFLSRNTPKIKIYGDGKQTRDFIFVRDVVRATIFVAKVKGAIGEVFNVGTSRETSILEIVRILEKLTGKRAVVFFFPERKGDIKRSVASIDKIEALGFKPKYDVVSGLVNTIKTSF